MFSHKEVEGKFIYPETPINLFFFAFAFCGEKNIIKYREFVLEGISEKGMPIIIQFWINSLLIHRECIFYS